MLFIQVVNVCIFVCVHVYFSLLCVLVCGCQLVSVTTENT